MIDLTKNRAKLKELYQPGTDQFVCVEVPELPFAVLDGHGSPDEGVRRAIQELYKAIYPIRREARERLGRDFVEPPVEVLYWADDMQDLVLGRKQNWRWRVMVTLPVWVDHQRFSDSVEVALQHLTEDPGAIRMEVFAEGMSAQIMHVGSAQDFPSTLARLYTDFLPHNNLEPAGAYHEIYLDDWSRVTPEKRKVILRQSVRPV